MSDVTEKYFRIVFRMRDGSTLTRIGNQADMDNVFSARGLDNLFVIVKFNYEHAAPLMFNTEQLLTIDSFAL